ncbi:MAG: 30S ribosomal protein S21 [bacterium]|jgi:small subunit ribosomal protein S21|nr:30S ribosomal protein S21 [bacterium]
MNIKIESGESFDQALKRFSRMVQLSGLIDEVKDREFYKKPSLIKKERKKERAANIKRYKRYQKAQ